MRRSLLAVGGALAAAMVLSACSAGAPEGDDEPKVLTLGVVGVESFDPVNMAGAGEGLTIWQGVYDTLITIEADGERVPGLATEWAFDDSLTTLTLELREGVEFSDGAAFDADAVKANFDHFTEEPGANIAMAAAITEVAAVDENTIEISLSQPDPGLETALGGPLGAMVSPAALAGEDLDTTPVGTGPYVMDLDRSAPGSEVVFTRSDADHWNADVWAWDEIVMKVMFDQSARLNALRAGEIDATTITSQAYDEVESAGMQVLSNPGDTIALGLFDRDGAVQPALADVRVRQAINYAFDRKEMLEAIELGHGSPAGALWPGIDPVGGATYEYDPEKARELLAEAGYSEGLSLTGVDLGTGSPLYAIITDRLAEIGIEMVWQPVAPTDAIAEMFSQKYPVLNTAYNGVGVGGDPWFFVSGYLTPTAIWNVFKNDDPELGALVEEARTSSGGARDEAYAKIDGWLSANAWFAPLYQRDYLYATSPDVTVEPALGNATPYLWSFTPAE